MTHQIEIQECTTYIDTAIVEMTDEQYTEFKAITEPHERQEFLSDLASDAEWVTGDFVDGDRPHFYTLDGEAQSVYDDLN